MGESAFDDLRLPAEFLTDDIILSDKENFNRNGGLGSGSSKVLQFMTESVIVSEIKEDFLTCLNRRFALSTLQQTRTIAPEETRGMSTSPQSILSSVFVSEAPIHNSPVLSPPLAPIGGYTEVKEISNNGAITSREPLIRPSFSRILSSYPVTGHNLTHNTPIWRNRQLYQTNGSSEGFRSSGYDVMTEIAWPLPQVQKPKHYQNQRPGGGCAGIMTAAVYGGGIKRNCVGTGVFLPRKYIPQSRKKSGSAAQLPSRVGKSINKKMAPQVQAEAKPHFIASHSSEINYHIINLQVTSSSETLIGRRNAMLAQEWGKHMMAAAEGPLNNNEIRLPHEWTY